MTRVFVLLASLTVLHPSVCANKPEVIDVDTLIQNKDRYQNKTVRVKGLAFGKWDFDRLFWGMLCNSSVDPKTVTDLWEDGERLDEQCVMILFDPVYFNKSTQGNADLPRLHGASIVVEGVYRKNNTIVGSSGAVRRLPLFIRMPSNLSGDISVPKNAVWERVTEPEKGSQKGGAK